MSTAIRLDTGRQKIRLAFGLIVMLAVTAAFAAAALVTADSTGKRIGAWVCFGLFLAATVALAWSGSLAVRPQALIVSAEGIAREAPRQPWRISWLELRAAAVEKSWSYTSVNASFQMIRPPKVWRVVVRLAPEDPGDFERRHPELTVYRGRFGAWNDEWGVWLGPPRELIAPLDEALRTYGRDVYQGHFDNGEQPRFSLFVRTEDVHPGGKPLP